MAPQEGGPRSFRKQRRQRDILDRDSRDRWGQDMQSVYEADGCGNSKPPPHRSITKKGARVVSNLVGKLHDWVGKTFLLNPLFSDDSVGALHHKQQDEGKGTPSEDWL